MGLFQETERNTNDIPGIKNWMRNGFKSKDEVAEQEQKDWEMLNESRRARGLKPLKREDLYDTMRDEATTK